MLTSLIRESSGLPKPLTCSKVASYSMNFPCKLDLSNQSATAVSPGSMLPKSTVREGLAGFPFT